MKKNKYYAIIDIVCYMGVSMSESVRLKAKTKEKAEKEANKIVNKISKKVKGVIECKLLSILEESEIVEDE